MIFGSVKNTIEGDKSFRYRELILHVWTTENGRNVPKDLVLLKLPVGNPDIACIEMKSNDHIYCINGDVISNHSI